MTNLEILEKAIAKAIAGGWLPYFAAFDTNMTKESIVICYPEGSSSISFDYQMNGHIVGVGGYDLEFYSIIFNQDFTKALWGENKQLVERTANYIDKRGYMEDKHYISVWQYHLQNMVIADDPIKYLGENLDKN